MSTSSGARRAHLVCGAILLALGALSLVELVRIKDEWQGAKLLPGALALVLAALGAGHFVPSAAVSAGDAPRWPDALGWRRIVLVFGLLAIYVAGLPWVGFLPATAIFVLVLLRGLGDYSWVKAIALTAAIALASYIVFQHLLGMPLPTGPFGV